MSEFIERPLADVARALRDGATTARALLAAASARREAAADRFDTYRTWAPDHAARHAAAADALLAAGSDAGPLQGIPVSLKDLYGVAGLPTFAGTPRRLPPRWEREGPLVTALRAQGAVPTGKTHTVEMAFGGLGVNSHWGTPRNPWDTQVHRVPGGSSSGAGVSLCEGSALLALGTDTAGSVRIPAAWTGNVGLKVSHGRWSLAGIFPLSPTLDTPGLLARTAADAAWAFAAIDPGWGDAEGLLDLVAGVDPATLRIGVAGEPLWSGCDPGVAEAARAALDALAEAGATLVDAPLPEAADAIELLHAGSVAAAECDAFLAAELPEWRDTLDPLVSTRIADGGDIPAREYLARRRRLDQLASAAPARFAHVDVIACPTVAITPPPLAEVSDLEGYRPCNMAALRNTCPGNFLGLCAITLPAGPDAAGLPVGLQLLAPHGEEEHLLAAALAAERVLGSGRERLGMPPV